MASKSNVLVMQSGGCTAVLNRSLYGLVSEIQVHNQFNEIFGAIHGIDGILSSRLVNLNSITKKTWHNIARTPGAALGSSRRKLKFDDPLRVLSSLQKRNIGYFFIIGGNDSAETGHSLAVESRARGSDINVVNIPKTIDNDLVLTDHCPGYGSAARFVALATMGEGKDAEAMGREAPITVLEVMGRDSGWLVASSALGKRNDRDPPHAICLPEVTVDEECFLQQIEEAYQRFGFAVAVVSENARGPKGVLGSQRDPWYVDDFGHAYFEGAGRYLAALVSNQMSVRTRYEKPGTIQRSMTATVSRTDAWEAEMVGRAAVHCALEKKSDKIITLTRIKRDRYEMRTGLAPLAEVAGKVRQLPMKFLSKDRHDISSAFFDYALPLIGPALPRFERLV